ncbi:MAG TPA: SRPBCC domain-containing protein [Sphingobacteriaceae bacterium]|nr:SRPBCC domain-containing protein [Sphingobacteriaceae bacterium]
MKDFKAYFIIPAEPEMVYKALTTQTTIALWTGEEAQMIPEPGTEFSMWSGAIVGRNISFVPNKQIEQEWLFGGASDQPSIVRIRLHEHKRGTSLEIRQTNIPEEDYENMSEGWHETYIASLLDFYS